MINKNIINKTKYGLVPRVNDHLLPAVLEAQKEKLPFNLQLL